MCFVGVLWFIGYLPLVAFPVGVLPMGLLGYCVAFLHGFSMGWLGFPQAIRQLCTCGVWLVPIVGLPVPLLWCLCLCIVCFQATTVWYVLYGFFPLLLCVITQRGTFWSPIPHVDISKVSKSITEKKGEFSVCSFGYGGGHGGG